MSGKNLPQIECPSERDVRVYVLHKVEGFSLRRIGAQVGVAPSRVHQIIQEVEPWVLGQLVAEHPDRLQQKMLATARLEHIFREAMRGWRRSLKNRVRTTQKTGGKNGASSETMVEAQAGDSTMLARAIDAQRQINDLWGLADPKKHTHEEHLTGTLTHVGDEPLSIDEQANQVIADLLSEAERRGIVIDVDAIVGAGNHDGETNGESRNRSPHALPPPDHDRREVDDASA